MKVLKYILVITTVLALFSCKEKTAESSKYSDYIKQLNTSLNQVDTSYKIFNQINHEALAFAYQTGKEKYDLVKKTIKLDSIDSYYDRNMNVYKSIYVKGLKNIRRKKGAIDEEYKYTKSQLNTLIPNLIQEKFTEDSVKIYFTTEKEALFMLDESIKNYNSIANNALTLQDSLNNNLDSLIRKYDKKIN
jgi:hypothetical protein